MLELLDARGTGPGQVDRILAEGLGAMGGAEAAGAGRAPAGRAFEGQARRGRGRALAVGAMQGVQSLAGLAVGAGPAGVGSDDQCPALVRVQ